MAEEEYGMRRFEDTKKGRRACAAYLEVKNLRGLYQVPHHEPEQWPNGKELQGVIIYAPGADDEEGLSAFLHQPL